jgi:hypothetical protein
MKFTRKQGDSLWIDITCDSADSIDSVWAHWTGVWSIAGTILTGSLIRSNTPGVFQLRIGPATVSGWKELPVGTYQITVQIDNSSVDYRHEESHKLIIQEQGNPDA